MRMDKLTHSLQAALGEAQSIAVGRDHPFIEPAHVLRAMLDAAGSPAKHLLRAAGAQYEQLDSALSDVLSAMPTVSGSADVHISADTQRLLNQADKLAQTAGDTFVSIDAVLLAMFEVKTTEKLISDSGVSRQSLAAAVESARGG